MTSVMTNLKNNPTIEIILSLIRKHSVLFTHSFTIVFFYFSLSIQWDLMLYRSGIQISTVAMPILEWCAKSLIYMVGKNDYFNFGREQKNVKRLKSSKNCFEFNSKNAVQVQWGSEHLIILVSKYMLTLVSQYCTGTDRSSGNQNDA